MKILWITNILFPEAAEKLTGKGDFRSSGGWMLSSADMIIQQEEVKLYVATVSPLVRKLEVIEGERITYYVLPYGYGNLKYNKEYEPYWKLIKERVNPDVVHIHGTEYTHGLAYIRACGNERVVVSVQGLKSGIAPYYCAGLTLKDIYRNITLRDIIKGSIYREQRRFYRTGELEKEMIRCVNHIIGRTSWDKAHIWSINPEASYHICNETLRKEFYKGEKWSYDKCIPHTIFLSQGGYPLKGLHQVLKAMPLILKHYPNTTIRVAGPDITHSKGLWGLLHFTGYCKIVKTLIKKLHLEDKVSFLGPLNAEQMKAEYLQSNVFICPSSIENSPNSLGEAQILGVPCVASYVGGIPDFMKGSEQYIYRFEEVEMLAEKVCSIFSQSSLCANEFVVDNARKRHDANHNIEQLLSIYKDLCCLKD